MMLASKLSTTQNVILFERGERLGKKLSATGNGQGNLTNLGVLDAEYFSQANVAQSQIRDILYRYDNSAFCKYLQSLGILWIADERGRIYPAGRQASAVTDALRFFIAGKGVDVRLGEKVISIEKRANGFCLQTEQEGKTQEYSAENVVLCAGGKAAKNFGTDGTAYALVKGFGHTVTPLFPSLVQLKTETTHVKTLKGIRINDGVLRAQTGDLAPICVRGDIIFTDYGVSGDAVFRISAFIADKIAEKTTKLSIDFLPDFSESDILNILENKRKELSAIPAGELLSGIVNNQVGRAVLKRADGDLKKAAKLIKDFALPVTGSLGFDYAQVTKGGIPLLEVDENLQSRFAPGLYFAGEILDVDGQCGGYNLQWAFSSAMTVADALNAKN